MNLISKCYWILHTQIGVDPRALVRSLRGLLPYVRDYFRFAAKYKGKINFLPCLNDRYAEGGDSKSEYFWQDLLIARKIFKKNPLIHVDVGSRIDGFVAHVASFREIEVVDIRPISSQIPGVKFHCANMMDGSPWTESYCDSISCLHAIEHFGLGRYGDPINPNGYILGLSNISRLLKNKGHLYLSVPIGIERVEFNAHRVFDPRTIVVTCAKFELRLVGLTIVQADGKLTEIVGGEFEDALMQWSLISYALGVFIFEKDAFQS